VPSDAVSKLSISSQNPDLYDETLSDLLTNKTPQVACCPLRALQQDEQEFIAWQKTFNRRYKTAEDRTKRLGIWRKSKQSIDDHNALFKQGKVDFEAELNIFADLTDQEYEQVQKYQKLQNIMNKSDSGQAPPSSSLAELAKYGGESYDSNGVKVESKTGPTTRGPVMTELDSEARDDDTCLTKSVFRRREAEEAESQRREEEGIMADMSFEEKKQYLIGMLKEEQLSHGAFKENMETLLAEQPKPKSGVQLQSNYEMSSLGGFGSA
jgi:hypothetical protein